MKRNYKILTGLAVFGLATYLVKKYRTNQQTSSTSTSGTIGRQKHMTDVFSNAKNMGTSAMS